MMPLSEGYASGTGSGAYVDGSRAAFGTCATTRDGATASLGRDATDMTDAP